MHIIYVYRVKKGYKLRAVREDMDSLVLFIGFEYLEQLNSEKSHK